MPWKLYDYVDEHGINHFKKWSEGLEKAQLGKLNQKLDMLERNGPSLQPTLLSDTGYPPIKKIKVKGNVHLRPMVCEGPISNNEYTLLVGAKEVGGKLQPETVVAIALSRRQEIINHPNRRLPHERVSPKTKK